MKQPIKRHLADTYRFEGFTPKADKVRGIFGHPKARILPLRRHSKKRAAGLADRFTLAGTTARYAWCVIYRVAIPRYTLKWKFAVLLASDVAR